MAVSAIHGLYAVEVDTTLIGGVTQQSVNTGSNVRGEASGGGVYGEIQSLVAQKPQAAWTTLAVAAALNAVGVLGQGIAALTAGLSLYAQKHAEGGTRAGTLSHRKYNIKEGLIVPRTLTVDHQGDATLGYEALVTYDGTNDPVVVTDAVTLPSAPTDDERFTLGKVTVGGVALAQVRSLSIDFGINAVTEGADSDIWDTHASIRTIQPVVTLRGIDLAWFKAANIPLTGKAATHANTTIYLRKRAAGGTFVADLTAQHVKVTADGLATIDVVQDASGGEPAEANLTLPLRYDGTNTPLVINTASAIT